MAKQRITIRINGKPYGFIIERDAEELYRLAEREVNDNIAHMREAHFKGFESIDCIAMVAFDMAVKKLDLQRSRTVADDEIEQLVALSEEVDEHLNTLT
jgi:cell division protein ZapA